MYLVNISDQTFSYRRTGTSVKNSVNTEQIQFNFGDSWNGLTKFACFMNDQLPEESKEKHLVMPDSNIVTIPWEMYTTEGTLFVGVLGMQGDLVVKPTVWVKLSDIVDGVNPDGEFAQSFTPSVAEQTVAIATNAELIAQSVRDDADAGKFAGKSPRVGSNGNWEVWNSTESTWQDTGIYSGGASPRIGGNGNWFVGTEDTGVKAQGPKGEAGTDGTNGFSPVVTVQPIVDGNRVTIADVTGYKTFDVKNGQKGDTGAPGNTGAQGDPGEDGFSPTVQVTPTPKGHTITITDTSGAKSFEVNNGKQGDTGKQGPKGDTGPAGPTGGIDLEITGAQVGQFAEITAVDASGKPTGWKAVPKPTGGGSKWILLNSIRITETVTGIKLDKTDDGRNYSDLKIRKMRIKNHVEKLSVPADAYLSFKINYAGGVIMAHGKVASGKESKESIVTFEMYPNSYLLAEVMPQEISTGAYQEAQSVYNLWSRWENQYKSGYIFIVEYLMNVELLAGSNFEVWGVLD